MDDKQFKLLKMEETDPIIARLERCRELIDEWGMGDEYYSQIAYQKMEEAEFFWNKFLETFTDSDV